MEKKEKLARACKEKMVDEIVSRLKESPNFVLTSYMGSSVSDLEALRRNLKKTDANYIVVKNSILKIVLEKIKLKEETSRIEGGMGISFCGKDIISACKALSNFTKDHGKFKIKSAYFDGQTLAPDKVKRLASLPPREVLLAQVVGGIKAPITGFVNTLSAVLRKFVYVVDAIKTSKEQAKVT